MGKRKLCCLLLALLLALTACGKTKTPEPAPEPTTGPAAEEYDVTGRYLLSPDGEAIIREAAPEGLVPDDNARVFYEIFVGSFSDSNGDGVGDLRGVIDRMDYLNDGDPASGLSLGVEGLWLTPIFASPSYHKYDVTDYYEIDPAFGTMDDLRELIALCHARGVKLILDLPINHTGAQNEWFRRFTQAHQKGDGDDESYYYYCGYVDGWESPDPGKTYAPIPGTNDFYECNFSPDMPELDFDSEAVRRMVLDVARYYLDMGVDGFRFDAAKYIYFGDDERSVEFWKWYIGELKKIRPDIYTVSEVWDSAGIIDRYIPASNCFDFTAAQQGLIAQTAKRGDVNAYTAYVSRTLTRLRKLNGEAMLVPFITNHDMDRAAGFLNVGGHDMHMAANLYLLSPGSPFIYYGEELGMCGSRGGANTDANRRLAMLWGDGDTVRDPEGSNYKNQADTSALRQRRSGSSLYNHYKRLLQLRRANPEIARGEYTPLRPEDTKLGGFVSEWEGRRVCVIHNTTMKSVTIPLADLGAEEFTKLTAFIGVGDASLDNGVLTVGEQTTVILR